MRAARAFLCGLPLLALAAVDGTVVNGTSGKPQPGASVALLKPGGASGMETVASVTTDAQGRFRFEQTPEGAHLVHATHQGVTYNLMLQPGAPASNLQLEVFDSSKVPGQAQLTLHTVLLEPSAERLAVLESFFYRNPGRLTYHDPGRGTLRLWLAGGASDVQVTAQGPGSMALQREAEKASQANVFKVDFPIKPGETRFDVTYSLPPGKFSGRALYKDLPTRLLAPAGVTLAGAALRLLGQEPGTQAAVYEVTGGAYEMTVAGTGSLRAAEPAAEEEGPGIQQIPPRLYDRAGWIVGLALAILALGFALLYRSRPPEAASPPRGARRQ